METLSPYANELQIMEKQKYFLSAQKSIKKYLLIDWKILRQILSSSLSA